MVFWKMWLETYHLTHQGARGVEAVQEGNNVAFREDKTGSEDDSRRGSAHSILEGEEGSCWSGKASDNRHKRQDGHAQEQGGSLAGPPKEHHDSFLGRLLRRGGLDLALTGVVHGEVRVVHGTQSARVLCLVLIDIGRVHPFQRFHEANQSARAHCV